MTTKTIQFLGLSFGSTPNSITVTANGSTIYSGIVPTVDELVPALPSPGLGGQQVTLFTYDIPEDFDGTIPMTCTVNSGTVLFMDIHSNYGSVQNPVYTPEQWAILNPPEPFSWDAVIQSWIDVWSAVATPPFTQEELVVLNTKAVSNDAILRSHGAAKFTNAGPAVFQNLDSQDPRKNVYIDGVLQTPDRTSLDGTWWWLINNGSTLSYDLLVEYQGY